MKNLLHFALALLLFSSCRKVDIVATPGSATLEKQASSSVQNLGHVFTGSNVSWKLHPLDPGNTPLFTYLPNQLNGYSLLMIDNGKTDGQTPISAFRFVTVNMQTMSSRNISVKGADGSVANYSFGRVITSIFGMDKKFYVATQGSPTGGGHLIQYDPFTQIAIDLGKPFKWGTSALDIYTLNVGTDGSLYGGSFGGDGQVMTFRYDYKRFYVDAAPLDNTSRFVTSISGDSRYTYAVCGKNNWFLYAIDRQTGEKRTLKSNIGSNISIDIASNTDAPYAHSVATHYRLSGFSFTALKEYDRPVTNRVFYVPYSETDVNVPKVSWNDIEKKVNYKLSNGQTGAVPVDGLQQDIYPTTGPMTYFNNKLYLTCAKQGLLGTYTPGAGFQSIGCTSMGIQTMAAPPVNSPDANKIFLGGYPTGLLLQYSPIENWTVNIAGFTNTNNGFATTSTNPKQSALFQKADAAGINGSMSLLGIGYTKNGTIAGAGNNDRITSSSGRELSMGSFKNGTVRNLYLPEFSDYEFQSFCLSADNNYAFVGAVPDKGNIGKLYKYDPATNSIVKSWNIPLWGNQNFTFRTLNADILVGICYDTIFLFDLNSGEIIWREALGLDKGIYAMTVAPDSSVYITHTFRSVTNYRVDKYNFNTTDRTNIKATSKPIAELQDQDNDERTKPTGIILTPGIASGTADLYVSGLNSLYRIKI
jgi:hypothetical protein